MKKTKIYLLLSLIYLTFLITGCGNSAKNEIRQTADAFLNAAENADYTTLSTYCPDTILSSIGLSGLNFTHTETHYYEHLEIDKSTLSKETQNSVSEYSKSFADNLIQNYTITEVTNNNGIGSVNATITSYSQEAKDYISGETFREELSSLMTTYQTEHLEELSSIYMTNGEEAMQQAFYDAAIPLIMDKYKSALNQFEPQEIPIVLIIEKENDLWKITDAYLVEE